MSHSSTCSAGGKLESCSAEAHSLRSRKRCSQRRSSGWQKLQSPTRKRPPAGSSRLHCPARLRCGWTRQGSSHGSREACTTVFGTGRVCSTRAGEVRGRQMAGGNWGAAVRTGHPSGSGEGELHGRLPRGDSPKRSGQPCWPRNAPFLGSFWAQRIGCASGPYALCRVPLLRI